MVASSPSTGPGDRRSALQDSQQDDHTRDLWRPSFGHCRASVGNKDAIIPGWIYREAMSSARHKCSRYDQPQNGTWCFMTSRPKTVSSPTTVCWYEKADGMGWSRLTSSAILWRMSRWTKRRSTS